MQLPSIFSRHPLSKAILVIAALSSVQPLLAESLPEPAPLMELSILPGPLGAALNQLAQRAEVALSFDPALTANQSSVGLQGRYSLEQALAQLLQGTGLEFERVDGSVILRQSEEASGPAVALDKVRVVGTDPRRYEASRASSATGSEVSLLDTPRSVQVVPEQIILDQQSQDLRDILRNVSGVQTRNISGGTTDAFLLRGVEVENIFQDGFQLDRSSTRVQSANIERVEVVKGPSALLTGQSQAGGVINVITKRPQADARHTVTTGFDEFGQRELVLDSTGKLTADETLLYRVVGSLEESETFREAASDAEIKRNLLAPSLTWRLSDYDQLSLSAEFLHTELPFDNGTVLTQSADGRLDTADISRSLRLGEDEDVSENNQRTFRLEYEHQAPNGVVFESGVSYQSARGNLRLTGSNAGSAPLTPGLPTTTALLLNINALGLEAVNLNAVPEGGVLIRSPFETETDRERFQWSLRLSGEAALGSTLHTLAIGTDYNKRKSDSQTDRAYISAADAGFGTLPGLPPLPGVFFFDFNALDLNNPLFGQVDSELRPNAISERTETQLGIFLSDIIELSPQWKALLGVRFDRFERKGREVAFFASTDDTNLTFVERQSEVSSDQGAQSEFSPNVGLVYQPYTNLAVFGSYSESFAPQFIRNFLTGEVLDSDPIESDQWELGLKGSFLNDKAIFNLAYYDITRENVPGVSNPLTGDRAFNEQEVRRGVELDTSVQFANGLNLIFNLSHIIDAEIKQGANQGNTPGIVADNVANLWATYEFTSGDLRGLGLGGGLRYEGSRFVTDGNLHKLDSYVVLDTIAYYYLPVGDQSQLRLQLGVKNLTDKEFFIPNNSTLALGVGAPRTVTASIGFEF